MDQEKPIAWVGISLDALLSFPEGARKEAGYQLHKVQNSLEPDDYRPFKQVGPGVREIRISESNGIYRVMYIAKFEEAVYVLHAFQKKTQKTSQQDIDIARTRYKAVIAARQ